MSKLRPKRPDRALNRDDFGSLVGLWFHSFKGDKGDEVLEWQGQVVGQVAPELLLVELYDWFMGETSCMRLVPVADMMRWRFYTTFTWMNNKYDAKLKPRIEAQIREKATT